jgi:hypothetical protein
MGFYLSDDEWAAVEPHMPKQGRGAKRVDTDYSDTPSSLDENLIGKPQ